jgi:hypothetical protein
MQKFRFFPLLMALSCITLLAACATAPQRPTFYPNNHFTAVGDEQAQIDTDACMASADSYGVAQKQQAQAGKKAAKGATLGAVTAGAWGLVRGDAGERALAGAAAGAAGGATSAAFDANNTNPTYKNFVHKCLADQGYDIIGWQ